MKKTTQAHARSSHRQQNEAKIAIKNGGLFGEGPGKGVQQHFVYAGESDFVYVLTIEQYGIIFGGLLPMFLYLLFFYRSIVISRRTSSVFGSLTIASLSFAFILQAAVNMAVNVGLIPVTGQTLPLISKGGTSIIFTCIAIGIILSISKDLILFILFIINLIIKSYSYHFLVKLIELITKYAVFSN